MQVFLQRWSLCDFGLVLLRCFWRYSCYGTNSYFFPAWLKASGMLTHSSCRALNCIDKQVPCACSFFSSVLLNLHYMEIINNNSQLPNWEHQTMKNRSTGSIASWVLKLNYYSSFIMVCYAAPVCLSHWVKWWSVNKSFFCLFYFFLFIKYVIFITMYPRWLIKSLYLTWYVKK